MSRRRHRRHERLHKLRDAQVERVSNPSLTHVVDRNIATINRLRDEAEATKSKQEHAADAITRFSGSMTFVYIHAAWFTLWVLINLGLVGLPPFDPYPFGLLTLIVSLEAIFLSTFVMIGQNRQTAFQRAKADHDFLSEERELRLNTELTTTIERLVRQIHQTVTTSDAPPTAGDRTSA